MRRGITQTLALSWHDGTEASAIEPGSKRADNRARASRARVMAGSDRIKGIAMTMGRVP